MFSFSYNINTGMLNNSEISLDNTEQERFTVVETENGKIYHFLMDTQIEAPFKYRDLSSVLVSANATDIINIYFNGPGGYADTAIQICNLIESTKATVIGHAIAPIASAHTFMFLACHDWTVSKTASMMLHCYSGGAWGKGKEIFQSAESFYRLFEIYVRQWYTDFLTEEEIQGILQYNKDFYFVGDTEILSRLELVAERRNKKDNNIKKLDTLQLIEVLQKQVEDLS